MAIPDFTSKIDPTIIAAFQNAQQQKMQAEAQQEQEKQRKFQLTLETTNAVGKMVSSMVDIAEKKKQNQLIASAKDILSQPEPQPTIPAGPEDMTDVPNPAVAARAKAKLDIAQALNPKELGEQLAQSAMPTQSTQSKRYQQGSAEVNGIPMLIKFDTQTGDYLDTDNQPLKGKQIKGFKPSVTTDPNTQELVSVGAAGVAKPLNSTATVAEVTDPLDLNVRQSNRLKELQKEFQDDELVKNNRMSLQSLNNLKTVQAEGTGALIGALQSLRARGIANEKGVLTEQDVLRTTGSPMLARRFSNAFNKMLLGKEDPQNIKEFNEALEAVEKATLSRNKRIEEQFIKRARSSKELNNVSEDLIRQNISIGTEAFDNPVPKEQREQTLTDGWKQTANGIKYRIKQVAK